MSDYPDPKRGTLRNFFPLPNEVYRLSLSAGAIAVYGYLLSIENRETYQCYASYQTIGKAVKMSANTVAKYVRELEENCFVRTEPTSIITRGGQRRNGSLLYNIRPIQEAVDHFHAQQMQKLEDTAERQKVQDRLSKLRAPCVGFSIAEQALSPPEP